MPSEGWAGAAGMCAGRSDRLCLCSRLAGLGRALAEHLFGVGHDVNLMRHVAKHARKLVRLHVVQPHVRHRHHVKVHDAQKDEHDQQNNLHAGREEAGECVYAWNQD